MAAPGKGKTSFLINEGASAARQGKTVLNIFLGDMLEYDGFVRYVSCISEKHQDSISFMEDEAQLQLIQSLNTTHKNILDRIDILAYPANKLTADQLFEIIYEIQKKKGLTYDMVIVDYADNLIPEMDTSYESWGAVYNKLALFSRVNNSVVMVASQPSKGYFSEEMIPLEGAAESAKKTHVADVVLTLGLVTKTANVGSMYLAKVRRGRTGCFIRFKTKFEYCQIVEIKEDEYVATAQKFLDEEPKKKKGVSGYY